MKHLVKSLIRRSGYEVSAVPGRIYGSRKEFHELLDLVRPYSMLPEARLFSLYEQVIFCEETNMAGAFVECGVWKGGATALMAGASSGRSIHLFDSFTDICEPSRIDGSRAIEEIGGLSAGKLAPVEGFYDHLGGHGSVSACREVLGAVGCDSSLINFHVGWFQETLPHADTGPIAILRLDGDWYESTKVCLDHLFDRVIPGGFIIVDDYGTYDGCRLAVDDFLSERNVAPFLHRIDAGCVFFIKRKVESPRRMHRSA